MPKKARRAALHKRKLQAGTAQTDGPPANSSAAPAAAATKISRTAKRNAMKRAAKKRAAESAAPAEAGAKKQKRKRSDRAVGAAVSADSGVLQVLFEDEHLIALNKPPGLLCHPSPGHWESGTVVHGLAARQRTPAFSPIPEIMLEARLDPTGEDDSFIPRAIVHRLDKGTSGVLLIAKTPRAEAHLGSAFRGRTTRKAYVVLLAGLPRLPEDGPWAAAVRERGTGDGGGVAVEAPIGREASTGGASRGRMAVAADGKPASSVVHLHAHSPAHGLTLASVDLHTGRQHQIRVHTLLLGAPVANDDLYDPRGAPAVRAALGAAAGGLSRGRVLLHACRMRVSHPCDGSAPLDVRAPLPTDIRSIVSRLWPGIGVDPAAWPERTLAQLAGRGEGCVAEGGEG